MTARKKKLVRRFVAGFLSLGVAVFVSCSLGESALLKEAPYDVVIPEDPRLEGRLYSLDDGQYLLVVLIPKTSTRRGFIVDMGKEEIGIPNFASYTRMGRFALVDKMTLWGYPPFYGGLLADFESINGSHLIRVTGHVADPTFADPETKTFLQEELIYDKRLILRPADRVRPGWSG
jgi:hypothetical protein